jgi:hypothetical protein
LQINLYYHTVGFADWFQTFIDAFRTIDSFATVVWAFDLADRGFTLHFATGEFGSGTAGSAAGRLANWLTNS